MEFDQLSIVLNISDPILLLSIPGLITFMKGPEMSWNLTSSQLYVPPWWTTPSKEQWPTCSRTLPCEVKRKRGNVYANVTLIVFRDVTLTKAK